MRGNSFFGHGKVVENHCWKRVVTLKFQVAKVAVKSVFSRQRVQQPRMLSFQILRCIIIRSLFIVAAQEHAVHLTIKSRIYNLHESLHFFVIFRVFIWHCCGGQSSRMYVHRTVWWRCMTFLMPSTSMTTTAMKPTCDGSSSHWKLCLSLTNVLFSRTAQYVSRLVAASELIKLICNCPTSPWVPCWGISQWLEAAYSVFCYL